MVNVWSRIRANVTSATRRHFAIRQAANRLISARLMDIAMCDKNVFAQLAGREVTVVWRIAAK